jgi:hypothetical protein
MGLLDVGVCVCLLACYMLRSAPNLLSAVCDGRQRMFPACYGLSYP